MAIRITCESCGERLNAPESHAGKRARCPSCKAVVQVPALYRVPPTGKPDANFMDELY